MAVKSSMISKFRGALVGALIGDCLGAYFEGDVQIPMNNVLQHFSAVKTYPRKKEGNGLHDPPSELKYLGINVQNMEVTKYKKTQTHNK